MSCITKLEPQAVWEHFQTLCNIPRRSKQESTLTDYLHAWATLKGLDSMKDAVGNLIIRKPATPGYEHLAGVILQGHLDMVCQANANVQHDFTHDPIQTTLKDGWLIAEHTTLGADNGIGVAMALAVLDSNTIFHGPLEVLLTIDEETGMTGALGLETGILHGDYLLNTDTEDWGEFYVGCAGGIDVNIEHTFAISPLPDHYTIQRLNISGLTGGHSGVDIHLGRANANCLLIRVLTALLAQTDLRLLCLQGGNARNAITREAHAVIAIPQQDLTSVNALIARYQSDLSNQFQQTDKPPVLHISSTEHTSCSLSSSDTHTLLTLLNATPYGVNKMSDHFENVVETSNNIGIVSLQEGQCFVNCLVRSLINEELTRLANAIKQPFSAAGFHVQIDGEYPCWKPNPDSALLSICLKTFEQHFGHPASVKVIHAGLECGIFSKPYPKLDMISFGPTIRGAHAPGERVNVQSVAQAWELLQALLVAIPAKS